MQMPYFALLSTCYPSIMVSSSDKCDRDSRYLARGTELETPWDRKTSIRTRHIMADFHVFWLTNKKQTNKQIKKRHSLHKSHASFSCLLLWISWAALRYGSTDNPAYGPDSREMEADTRLRSLPDPCPASHTGCVCSCLLNNTGLLI